MQPSSKAEKPTAIKPKAFFHLPGLFEFYDFYKVFLPVFYTHRDWFYDWCEIGSIYGAPGDCIWGGGRVGFGDNDPEEVKALLDTYKIPARLTFSNSLLKPEHLSDSKCNGLLRVFDPVGVIIYSDLLLTYIRSRYPENYFISSTTKVLMDFSSFKDELDRPEFRYVVPDFRLNKRLDDLAGLSREEKDKTEFLVNECCWFACPDRKACYQAVSAKALGLDDDGRYDHLCQSPGAAEGYVFSKAMKNPGFISPTDIQTVYMPMGFSQFKIEGRSLGSALILEFLLYYMTKPEYQLNVREKIYLTNELDLF